MNSKLERKPGEMLGTLKAVPMKRSLRNDARKLGMVDAFAEIVDNAIDNFAKQERLNRIAESLHINIKAKDDEVIIRENSGGVTPQDLQAFVQVGGVGSGADAPHIGVWGAGQKQAIAALGNDVVLSTRYWNSKQRYEVDGRRTEQVVLRMDENWWASEEDWDIPVYIPDEQLPAGETLYEIRRLNRPIDEIQVDDLRKNLQSLYGDMLEQGIVAITLNGVRLEGLSRLSDEALSKLFAFPPGLEPAEHWHTLTQSARVLENGVWKEQPRSLRMRIIVGLTPTQDPDAGVHMWGVPETESGAQLGPRWFAGPLQTEAVGYTTGPRSLLRPGHPTLGRLRINVVFYGSSEAIPWGLPGSPVKREYNSHNIFAREITEHIKDAARPYTRFTTRARAVDVVPYSKQWNDMSEADRKAVLRRGAFLQAPEEIEDADVKPKVVSILKHRFKPKGFRVWDHDKDRDGPPELVPAFSDKLASGLASNIVERDKRLHELKDDAAEAVSVLVTSLRKIQTQNEEGWSEDTGDDEGPERTIPVTVRVSVSLLKKLTRTAGTKTRSEAVLQAIEDFVARKGR